MMQNTKSMSLQTSRVSKTVSMASSSKVIKVIEETPADDDVESIATTPLPNVQDDNNQTPQSVEKDSRQISSNEGTILAHYRRLVQKCKGSNCANCSANLLLMINCFIAITGLGLTTVGTWLMLDQEAICEILSEADVSPRHYVILLISVGVVLAVLAALSICVLVTKTPKYLALYIILLSLSIGGTIALAVYFVHFGDHVAYGLEDGLANAIRERYKSKGNEDLTSSIHSVQEMFQCCGSRNGEDFDWYKSLSNSKLQIVIEFLEIPYDPKVHASCCKDCKDQGCAEKVVEWFDFLNHILIAVLCAVATLQTFSLGSAAMLCHFLAKCPCRCCGRAK